MASEYGNYGSTGQLLGLKLPRDTNNEIIIDRRLRFGGDLQHHGPVIGLMTVADNVARAVWYGTYEKQSVWLFYPKWQIDEQTGETSYETYVFCYPKLTKLSPFTDKIDLSPYIKYIFAAWERPNLPALKRLEVYAFCLAELLSPGSPNRRTDTRFPWSRIIPKTRPIVVQLEPPSRLTVSAWYRNFMIWNGHISQSETSETDAGSESELDKDMDSKRPSSKSSKAKSTKSSITSSTSTTQNVTKPAAVGNQASTKEHGNCATTSNTKDYQSLYNEEQNLCSHWQQTAILEQGKSQRLGTEIKQMQAEKVQLEQVIVNLRKQIVNSQENERLQEGKKRFYKAKLKQARENLPELSEDEGESTGRPEKRQKLNKLESPQ